MANRMPSIYRGFSVYVSATSCREVSTSKFAAVTVFQFAVEFFQFFVSPVPMAEVRKFLQRCFAY
jgi:hypothetical protein